MPVGVFRGGCLTGPQHAAVELHGYLAFIVMCATTGRQYTVHGYKGEQVRDQIHSRDVATLFLKYFRPRVCETYNLGGGRQNSLSILETVEMRKGMGFSLKYKIREQNRVGDHICYISDLTELRSHFPQWQQEYNLERIVAELIERRQIRK